MERKIDRVWQQMPRTFTHWCEAGGKAKVRKVEKQPSRMDWNCEHPFKTCDQMGKDFKHRV